MSPYWPAGGRSEDVDRRVGKAKMWTGGLAEKKVRAGELWRQISLDRRRVVSYLGVAFAVRELLRCSPYGSVWRHG